MVGKDRERRHAEAARLVARELDVLRAKSFSELLLLETPETKNVVSESGVTYQMENFAIWDDRGNEVLRVIVSTDGGEGWTFSDFESDDFLVSPTGVVE